MKDEAVAAKPQKETKQKSKVKVVLLFLVVFIVLGGCYYTWQFFLSYKDGQETRAVQIIASRPLDFTVNLADTEQRRYLKATVQLGYGDKNLTREIEKKVAEIRDLIIELFRSRTVTQINTLEGTDLLRAEMKAALNKRLHSGEILEVYFTEFIIQ